MGACGSNQFNAKSTGALSIRHNVDKGPWGEMKNYHFDEPATFHFVQEMQDVYTNTYGGFLLPVQMGGLLLEFKRYFYVVQKFCKAENAPRQAVEDRSGNTMVVPLTQLLPSPIIDRLWRGLIVNTRVYEKFCQRMFGGVLERDGTKMSSVKDYAHTKRRLQDEFSTYDHIIWPNFESDQKLQESFDGFLWILLYDFMQFHVGFKRDLTKSYSSFPPQRQEEEMNKLRNKHLRRHPHEEAPRRAAFDMGTHNIRQGGEFRAGTKDSIAEPLVNASPSASVAHVRDPKSFKIQMEPKVGAPPPPPGDDDEDAKVGSPDADPNDDFFRNFHDGGAFDLESDSQRGGERPSAGARPIATTRTIGTKQETVRVHDRYLEDDDVNPEFISDEEESAAEAEAPSPSPQRAQTPPKPSLADIAKQESEKNVNLRVAAAAAQGKPEERGGLDVGDYEVIEVTERDAVRRNDEQEGQQGDKPPADPERAGSAELKAYEQPSPPKDEAKAREMDSAEKPRVNVEPEDDKESLELEEDKEDDKKPVGLQLDGERVESKPAAAPVQPRPVERKPFAGLGDSHEWLQSGWEKQLATLRKVQDFPIAGVVQRNFQREINTTVMLSDAIFTEYKRFHILLALTRQRRARLIPPHLVKLAWEYHLIETAHYRRFCFEMFQEFVHSLHLPRLVDQEQKEDYINTMKLYQVVFSEAPPTFIWSPMEQRFNYDDIYNIKYVNLKGYMIDILSKAQSKGQRPQPQGASNMKERIQCLAKMKYNYTPDRGSQYILEEEKRAEPQIPIKQDPGAEFYQQPVLTSSNAKLDAKSRVKAEQDPLYNQKIDEEVPRYVTPGQFETPNQPKPRNPKRDDNEKRRNMLAAYV